MEFVAMVVALLIERFLRVDNYLYRFNWFHTYIDKLQKALNSTGLFTGAIGFIIILLPIVIIVGLVYYLLHGLFWNFIGFILSTAILIYCLGPRDFYSRFQDYFVAVVRDDQDAKHQAAKKLLCILPADENDIPRTLTKSVFNHFNYEIFTVIFWFLLLGPLAAVIYRTVAEIHKYAHMKDSPLESMLPIAAAVMQIIEWVPLRVMGLGFALMGDFQRSYSCWLKSFSRSYKENYQFTQQVGLAALGIIDDSEGSQDVAEVKEALRLVDRTLILFIALAALVVVGALLY